MRYVRLAGAASATNAHAIVGGVSRDYQHGCKVGNRGSRRSHIPTSRFRKPTIARTILHAPLLDGRTR